jgi:hypothetical protein
VPAVPRLPQEPKEQGRLAAWLDCCLLAALLHAGATASPAEEAAPALDLPGLSLTADAVLALLHTPEGMTDPLRAEAEAKLLWRRVLAVPGGVLARLSSFGLDGMSLRVLALCIAPDLDGRYAKVFGFLHDDLTRRRASLPILRQLLEEPGGERVGPVLATMAPLRRLGLLHAEEGEPASALASLHADPVLLCAFEDDLPSELVGLVQRKAWSRMPGAPAEQPDPDTVAQALAETPGDVQLLRISSGQRPERRAWAEALLERLEVPPLRLELADAPPADAKSATLLGQRLALVARLELAVPVVDLAAAWLQPEGRGALTALLSRLVVVAPLVLLLTDSASAEPALPASVSRRHVRLRPLQPEDRRTAWSELAQARSISLGPIELDLLTGLRLERSEITQAVDEAECAAWLEERPDGAALLAAGRRLAATVTPNFARRIPPELRLDRIVLPPDREAQLREMVVQLRHSSQVNEEWGFGQTMLYGRGVTALFAGPSGTGKTFAARAIAGELGIDLLQIDLAQVVSKYIGETEKNLSTIFSAAEASEVGLLFDEADALFGKRSEVRDAHDRYANIETAYLLQRIEEFTGLAILTTNLKPNLDTAFLRRLRFVIDFPQPDAALRAEIWRRAFPARAPLDPDLDLDLLAERLELTGGSIQSAALRAAYLAAGEDTPIAMRHVVYACRRELLKLGQLSAERGLAVLAAEPGELS